MGDGLRYDATRCEPGLCGRGRHSNRSGNEATGKEGGHSRTGNPIPNLDYASPIQETGSRGIAREIFFKDFKANGKPVFGDFQGSGQIV